MSLRVYADKVEASRAAAAAGARRVREALSVNGHASVIVATGASQFDMLTALAATPGIDWRAVTLFHLDEYVGLPESHPASFRKYIRERFVARLPAAPAAVHYVDGSAADPKQVCAVLGQVISRSPVDVAFIGVGENGHIAFNDPPADFDTEEPYLVVTLDEACRRQQLGEGWFPTLADVPQRAISMSVRQILKSKVIINTVPDARKATAVRDAVEGPLSPCCPASALRLHRTCETFLDRGSASLLTPLAAELARV